MRKDFEKGLTFNSFRDKSSSALKDNVLRTEENLLKRLQKCKKNLKCRSDEDTFNHAKGFLGKFGLYEGKAFFQNLSKSDCTVEQILMLLGIENVLQLRNIQKDYLYNM